MAFSRLCLLSLFCLLPCTLQGAPLPFVQALQLAIDHNPALAQPASSQSQPAQQTADLDGHAAARQSCPIRLQDYAALTAQLVAAQLVSIFLYYNPAWKTFAAGVIEAWARLNL